MHEHACVLAAGTLVTVTNLCLQHTLKMVTLTGPTNGWAQIQVHQCNGKVTVNYCFPHHTALPQGVREKTIENSSIIQRK